MLEIFLSLQSDLQRFWQSSERSSDCSSFQRERNGRAALAYAPKTELPEWGWRLASREKLASMHSYKWTDRPLQSKRGNPDPLIGSLIGLVLKLAA